MKRLSLILALAVFAVIVLQWFILAMEETYHACDGGGYA